MAKKKPASSVRPRPAEDKPRRNAAVKRRPASPGGPGAMDALRRAQAKLKEMGVKPYKPSK